jgi:hypothetical protein
VSLPPQAAQSRTSREGRHLLAPGNPIDRLSRPPASPDATSVGIACPRASAISSTRLWRVAHDIQLKSAGTIVFGSGSKELVVERTRPLVG